MTEFFGLSAGGVWKAARGTVKPDGGVALSYGANVFEKKKHVLLKELDAQRVVFAKDLGLAALDEYVEGL